MAYQQVKTGILGGGQLGKMLIQAGADLNINPKILDPDPSAPCSQLSAQFHQGKLTDYTTVLAFGRGLDVLTIEIENVNTEALEALEQQGVKVFPQPHIIRLIQDKRTQKQFFADNGIPTAPFVLTENKDDVAKASQMFPAVHKLGREGYDGRGVQKIHSIADVHKAFDAPGVLEQMIDFEKEIAVIIARNPQGEVSTFPVVELVFHPKHNLVEYLFAPAHISSEIEQKATSIARSIVEALNFTGLLAVEMFVDKQGEVLVNEMAPRPHNSGHHSIEANLTSQYEQLWRAILGLPLGHTDTIMPAAMVNLLGEAGHEGPAVYEGLEEVLRMDGVYIHLYGKAITKPFRKMGHVTIMDRSLEKLHHKLKVVQERLKVLTH